MITEPTLHESVPDGQPIESDVRGQAPTDGLVQQGLPGIVGEAVTSYRTTLVSGMEARVKERARWAVKEEHSRVEAEVHRRVHLLLEQEREAVSKEVDTVVEEFESRLAGVLDGLQRPARARRRRADHLSMGGLLLACASTILLGGTILTGLNAWSDATLRLVGPAMFAAGLAGVTVLFLSEVGFANVLGKLAAAVGRGRRLKA